MMELSANEAQLEVGLGITTQLRNTIDNTETDFLTGIENVINQAIEFKFDLEDTIDADNVTYEFDNSRLLIEDMENLAQSDYELVKKYETGFLSEWQFKHTINKNTNFVNPEPTYGALASLLAWESLLGVMESGEIFTDGIWYYSASNAALNGDKEFAEELQNSGLENSSEDLIRNSDRYRRVTRGAIFDHDSSFAAGSRRIGEFAFEKGVPGGSIGKVVIATKEILSGANERIENGEDFDSAIVDSSKDYIVDTFKSKVGEQTAIQEVNDYIEAKDNAEEIETMLEYDERIEEASELSDKGDYSNTPISGGGGAREKADEDTPTGFGIGGGGGARYDEITGNASELGDKDINFNTSRGRGGAI